MMTMTAHIETSHRTVKIDLARPMPISIRLRDGAQNPLAWYAPYPTMTPVAMEGFIGSVAQGGSVNTSDITMNPHGNGTHTECIGHLTEQAHELDEYMRNHIHLATVLTVEATVLTSDDGPNRKMGDRVIMASVLDKLKVHPDVKALVIRTTPNTDEKLTQVYTGHNPTYLDPALCRAIRVLGFEHLLLDLPSVDRESDGGLMLAHRAFWYDEDGNARMHSTITEMVYVPNKIIDGEYLINIMVAPLGNDASPSKPILYPIIP